MDFERRIKNTIGIFSLAIMSAMTIPATQSIVPTFFTTPLLRWVVGLGGAFTIYLIWKKEIGGGFISV